MGKKFEIREVSGLVGIFRDLFLGRKYLSPLRYGPLYAARTQPPPEIPGGPAHKLSNNYYYERDPRREVNPPLLIASGYKQISAPGEGKVALRSPTPGNLWQWD
ncbi:hypothetical protein O3M35_004628 [Rhynocoris fuscipes]|uniref:NADH dehydrogenase [ubiquinone] 1 alpha subcomplex subunit 7 n=1 Tax=Rhynocoris fuscipes TaxID=488301 RepID=A0AAW1CLZ3_9HEMI